MNRTVSRFNSYRSFPVDNSYRAAVAPYSEASLYISQGRAKRLQLGQTGYPFRDFFVKPSTLITGLRYKQDAGSWNTISQGTYPDLITAARAVSFSPEVFAAEVTFTLEISTSSRTIEREVDIFTDVKAGRDKVARQNYPVTPFYDALFCTDGSLLTAVNYKVDSGSKTAIPSTFGSDLAARARAFTLTFSSSGEKKVTLYVTDGDSAEYSDSITIRVE